MNELQVLINYYGRLMDAATLLDFDLKEAGIDYSGDYMEKHPTGQALIEAGVGIVSVGMRIKELEEAAE